MTARRLAAILAADVVGYSRLMGEDEAGTARIVRERREAAARNSTPASPFRRGQPWEGGGAGGKEASGCGREQVELRMVLTHQSASCRAGPAPAAPVDIMRSSPQHQDMRTTLTLDDDVAAKLKAESRRAGRPFKEIVNEALRSGLATRRAVAPRRCLQDYRPRPRRSEAGALPRQCCGTYRTGGRLPASVMLVDANLLIYAYHPRAEQHERSRAWLEKALSGPELIRFAWLTLWAFLQDPHQPAHLRASAFRCGGRGGDLLLARSAVSRHSRAGRAALGHPTRPCAGAADRRPACHGHSSCRDRP